MTNPPVPPLTLGFRLRMAMEFAGRSREQMAADMEVSLSTISRWTHDGGRPPRTRDLHHWADLCGIDREWLVTGEQPSSQDRHAAALDADLAQHQQWRKAHESSLVVADETEHRATNGA